MSMSRIRLSDISLEQLREHVSSELLGEVSLRQQWLGTAWGIENMPLEDAIADLRMLKTKSIGYVYVVDFGSFVKIGQTEDPASRLQAYRPQGILAGVDCRVWVGQSDERRLVERVVMSAFPATRIGTEYLQATADRAVMVAALAMERLFFLRDKIPMHLRKGTSDVLFMPGHKHYRSLEDALRAQVKRQRDRFVTGAPIGICAIDGLQVLVDVLGDLAHPRLAALNERFEEVVQQSRTDPWFNAWGVDSWHFGFDKKGWIAETVGACRDAAETGKSRTVEA